jgi:prepilin-type N-terminal cleavage/methylation domain-containing protein
MRTRHRTHRRKGGFTLVEILIAMTLLALIGAIVTSVLLRQQRFHRAVTSITDARARMRDIATILPTDLRSISTIGGDVLALSDTALQFRAFIGSAVLCRYASATVIEVPPRVMASGNVLTAWINPPAPQDVAFMYNDSTSAGNSDDSWTAFTVTDTTSGTDATWCPSTANPAFTQAADNGQRRYRITLSAAPTQAQIKLGAPIRFAREVRYSVYQASDNQWYVGFQRCTPSGAAGVAGACGTREVLAGPVLPASTDTLTSGLFFVYYNQTGVVVTDVAQATTIASIGVGIRTASESLRRAAATQIQQSFSGGDSLRFTIGIRNRI